MNKFVARRSRLYIFRLRGIFIKLGQFLGVTSNLFWPEVAKELEDLQDKVPPVPYRVIERRFLHDFNKTPKEIFQQFDETPIASASLGQVHFAVTHHGDEVAVKTLYPGMEELVRRDLKSIKAILSMTNIFFPYLDFDVIYKEFADMVLEEIDYEQERLNLLEIKKNFENEQDYIFPDVKDEHCSKTVITTEFISGIKINNISELEEQNIDTQNVAQLLIKAYYKMIFVDQKFHSDPHPGNIFVVHSGEKIKIAFIDFGSVEVFTERFRRSAPKLINAIIHRRIPHILDTFEEMGFISRMVDRDEIERLIAYRYDKLESLNIKDYRHLNIKDFGDFEALKKLNLKLSEIMRSFQIPRNYMYFSRTLMLLSGLAAKLDPKVNIFQIAWPYLEQFVAGKDKTFTDFIKDDIYEWASDVVSLPEHTIKALEIVNQGKFKIEMKDLNKNTRILYLLGHQFIYTLMLITSGTFALVLYIHEKYQYSDYFIYLALFFAVILIISLFKHRKLKR